MKVLILEDDPILQIDLAFMVSDLGHEVMGPFGNEDTAWRACESALPDAAIVDFNLGPGLDSSGFATMLLRNKVRFAFFSAYGHKHMPDCFRDVPIYEKPYSPPEVEAFLAFARD